MTHRIHDCEVYNAAFRTFAKWGNHHHYLGPGHFHRSEFILLRVATSPVVRLHCLTPLAARCGFVTRF